VRSEFDPQKNEFTVTITNDDLNKAMRSADDLYLFMHNIVSSTYGDWMAEAAFPLNKSEDKKGEQC